MTEDRSLSTDCPPVSAEPEPNRRGLFRKLGLAGLAGVGLVVLRGSGALEPLAGAGVTGPGRAARPSAPPKPRPVLRPIPARQHPVQHVPRPLKYPDGPGRSSWRDGEFVALTLDDGPSPKFTPQVLDLLAEHRITATFFVIGRQVTRYPDLVRRTLAAGHSICNHSQTHPITFGRLDEAELRSEIGDAWKAIADVTGEAPRLFRSPGGAWNHAIRDVVAEHGMIPAHWSVDTYDWRRPGGSVISERLLSGCEAGSIMLCHDGGGNRSQTVAGLTTALPRLLARKYRFVNLGRAELASYDQPSRPPVPPVSVPDRSASTMR